MFHFFFSYYRSDENTNKELRICSRSVRFYKGFQLALQFLINTITETDKHAVIIHGVPHVGKTSLVHALAYTLATKDKEPVYLKMSDKEIDSNVAADHLAKVTLYNEWVIVDQCDMDAFSFNQLAKNVNDHYRYYSVPIVFFTSGHIPPGPKFDESHNPIFLVKVVDIQTNEEALQSESPVSATDDITNVLRITKQFSRALGLDRG